MKNNCSRTSGGLRAFSVFTLSLALSFSFALSFDDRFSRFAIFARAAEFGVATVEDVLNMLRNGCISTSIHILFDTMNSFECIFVSKCISFS